MKAVIVIVVKTIIICSHLTKYTVYNPFLAVQ